ncbi:MAG: D-alanyl-D-alanine carboxypeptidase family protein [Pyrinomonadaceae bacterium]|nr:D-alanyl-D-alanine carboxypeptidase family protein [Pyrinomonadaceae bacterium]
MTKSKGHALLPFKSFAVILMIIAAATFSGCVQSESSLSSSSPATQTPSPKSSQTVRPLMAAATTTPAATPAISATPQATNDTATQQASLEAATSSALAPNAKQNIALMENLEWTFGGKQQRGWRIYVPLISLLIETEAGADTNEFAAILARWQKSAGLAPSGVLDNSTLSAMVSTWQSRRSRNRAAAESAQIITAPPSDFYDPSRPDELRQVDRATHEAYKRMVAAAIAERSLNLAATPNGELAPKERFLKIVSAYRSRAYQEKLRREQPDAGRAALAVNNSPHFTGRALDIYVGGEPVETKDPNRLIQVGTPHYRWLIRNAARFGFHPYFYEPWHWEYKPQQ